MQLMMLGRILLSLACLFPPQSWSQAQTYPNKPIRMVVPYAPGASSDIFARMLGQKLTEAWGQQVVMDNRPGAGGGIGAEQAAKSAPDGYTLLMGTSATFGMNVSLYKKLPYDPIKDFAPVALVANTPYMVLAHPSFPANSIAELITMAKAQPGKLDIAGGASPAQLGVALFNSMAGTKLTYVAYKSTPLAVTDVLAGHVSLLYADPAPVVSYIRSGKLKVLAVATSKRMEAFSEVPTVAESGLSGYEVVGWWAIMAPAGTPKDIIAKLNSEFFKIIRMPDVKDKLAGIGIHTQTQVSSPEYLADYIRVEIPKWAQAVKAAGLQPQ